MGRQEAMIWLNKLLDLEGIYGDDSVSNQVTYGGPSGGTSEPRAPCVWVFVLNVEFVFVSVEGVAGKHADHKRGDSGDGQCIHLTQPGEELMESHL